MFVVRVLPRYGTMGSPHGQGFGETIGGSNEKTFGMTPTRGLLAVATAPEAAKTTWIYSFVTHPLYGAFFMNVLADIAAQMLLVSATALFFRFVYRSERIREGIAWYLENQRHLGQSLAIYTLLESRVVGSRGSPGTPPVLQADNSTAQSSSAAPPQVPENYAQTAGSIPAGSVPGSPTSSMNAVPTEPKKAVRTTKQPWGQLRRRRLNGYTTKSRSIGHAASTSSESPPVAITWSDVDAKDHHVIDRTFLCRLPSLTETKKGNKFKGTVKEKLGVDFGHDVCSSRLMQARVPATEENPSALREVAIEGMKLDKRFTLQIGASFLYCCTGDCEEPVLLSLRDVKVPAVLQAEYSAGMLIVRGRYLEGAEIRAATSEGYMIFASVKQGPIDNEPEERIGKWRCTGLLPPVNLDQIQIFASKTVSIEGQSVTVRSELCSIQDTTLKTENLVTERDWEWPIFTLNDQGKPDKFDPDSNECGSNFDADLPFEVLYGTRTSQFREMELELEKRFVNSPYIPKGITVKLYSKHLQDVVRKCFPGSMKQFEYYGEIQAKYVLLLYIHGELPGENSDSWSKLPSTSGGEYEKADLDMFHLKRFLEKEFGDIIKQHNRMMEAGIISWDMLWTLIVPGADVIYYCEISNEELCGKVSTADYEVLQDKSLKFSVDLEVYDFDCNNFVVANVVRELLFFKEDVEIIDLDVFPLQCKANPLESGEGFLQRGRKFCDLVFRSERQFMHYSGLMYGTKKGGPSVKASIDGRVMIDQKWFAKLKSRRNMGTARARGWNPIKERSEVSTKATTNEFDSLLKYSPAIAYGYSFSIRKWGRFNIVGFSRIRFVSTAFDKLVMKEEKKRILLALTEYYISKTRGINSVATHIDILPNEGQGCIIVLDGPPGTGKTLTVESLAERLQCPLLQLSISKFTTSTKKLENKILSIFEVAKSWGAILVLDGADVYRTSSSHSVLSYDSSLRYEDTPNNEMTVFLRVLELFEGVLFVTTNNVSRMEPAFSSRISLLISYEEFNTEERKKLWSNFLEERNISDLSKDFWQRVLGARCSARVIQNIIRNAQVLIRSNNFGPKTPEECVLEAFDARLRPEYNR